MTFSRFESSCPMLRRICYESLRLTAHSIGGVRTAKQDVLLKIRHRKSSADEIQLLYRIPKGSSVGFTHIVSSLDTNIWGDNAAVFDSSCHHSEELYMDEYKFTAFSHGVHKCPGRQLAMIQLQVTLALLLTEFDVSLPPDEPIPPLSFERATLAQRDGPVMVSIQRRKSENNMVE